MWTLLIRHVLLTDPVFFYPDGSDRTKPRCNTRISFVDGTLSHNSVEFILWTPRFCEVYRKYSPFLGSPHFSSFSRSLLVPQTCISHIIFGTFYLLLPCCLFRQSPTLSIQPLVVFATEKLHGRTPGILLVFSFSFSVVSFVFNFTRLYPGYSY